MNSPLLSPSGANQPARRRLGQGRHREQAVPVPLPVQVGEQTVLRGLVVARVARVRVHGRPQVPTQRRDHRSGGDVPRQQRVREQAGARHARAVDQEPDEVALRELGAHVGRVGGRGRRRIDPDRTHPSGERREHRVVDGHGRAVVDDDHLVVVGRDALLVFGRERSERAGQLARHVVDDDDDTERRLAGPEPNHQRPPHPPPRVAVPTKRTRCHWAAR